MLQRVVRLSGWSGPSTGSGSGSSAWHSRSPRAGLSHCPVLAATLSAHGSAAFDVAVLAGLGGDATRRQGSGLAVVVAAEEAGKHVDEFEQRRVYLDLLVSGVLGAVAGDE